MGISVMKAFSGGQLLDEKTSPLGCALTEYQCIQYALDKVDAGAKYVPPKEKKRIPVNDFKKICEVQ